MSDKKQQRQGFVFKSYEAPEQDPFEKLFEIFQELIIHTSGDLDEALDWLNELDKEYHLTDDDYSMDDFIEDLKKRGYIKEEVEGGMGGEGDPSLKLTEKTERQLRKHALISFLAS